jgi:hypothetical protein
MCRLPVFVFSALVALSMVAAPGKKERSYLDTTWWDPHVENIADTDTYLRRKFRQDVTDKTTGLDQDGILRRMEQIAAEGKAAEEPWRVTKSRMFADSVTKSAIDVSPFDWFPAISIWNRRTFPMWKVCKGERAREVNGKTFSESLVKEWREGNAAGDWRILQDFDHSVPEWRAILKLGFPGMKMRLGKYAVKGDPFYEALEITADAILAGIDRFIAQGEKNLSNSGDTGSEKSRNRLQKGIACLKRLRNGPPQTAYDAMMFIWL